MLFQPEHIELIKQGKKWETRRRWQRNRALIGSVHQMTTELYGVPKGYLFVYDTDRQPLTYVNHVAEGYPTRDAFKAVWQRINKKWNYKEVVYVVRFVYVTQEEAETLKKVPQTVREAIAFKLIFTDQAQRRDTLRGMLNERRV